MKLRRNISDVTNLCSGPGKLTQSLGITSEMDGVVLTSEPILVTSGPATALTITGPRIGISKAIDQPWRFGLDGSKYLSRKF